MDVKELRVGNCIKQGKVSSIYYDGHLGMDDGNAYPIDVLSPIPLTHLVLLNVGFVKESTTKWTYGARSEFNIPPMMLIDQFTESMFLDDKYGKIIKTLHELQNFFYSVTGKELPVKQI